MEETNLTRQELTKIVVTRILLFFPVMALFFFLPAGTFQLLARLGLYCDSLYTHAFCI